MIDTRKAAQMDDVDIHDRAFVADPFGAFERLRRECPVAHSSKHGGFWLLTRYDDVRSAALDWRGFTSSVVGVTAIPVITPRTQPQLPIEIDPPQHSRYRALVNPVFAPARVVAITPRIEAFIRDRLEAMSAKGSVDAVAEFCVPVAITALAAFTDIPLADSERWVEWITRMFDVTDPERGAAASRELVAYVDVLIAERRLRPQDDFISTLITAEIDGERLDDIQIRSFLTVVFGAGFETTADALSLMLQWIADHPDALTQLADPESIPLAVEEFLRHSSPIQIFGRNATKDMCLHGRDIAVGDIVALGFGAANHDPAVFDAPEEMHLDRQPNRHLTFGAGPHLCAGAAVARMEMGATLRMLVETGVSLAPDPDEAPRLKTRGDRHGLASLPLLVEKKTKQP
ncbi:cytochrome P450 [Mesorhizobium sp. KR9-304]|uniref:cytochrome P450 n=1 Tax=Mesorhizobium sp. KR9-304 TaxID=3156614 RepID=UPI0032B5D2DB